MKRLVSLAVAVVALAGFTASGAANASGGWSANSFGPTIYQSNWQYNSSWMTPPASIPSTATMTHASWNTSFNYTPAGLAAWLHLVNNGYLGLPSLSGFSAVGTPGLSAKQNMRFAFVVQRASPVLLPQPAFAGSHSLSVTYQF